MRVNCVETNGRIEVMVEGRVGHHEVDLGREPISEACGPEVYGKRVLIDLGNTEYMDSVDLSWLLICHRRCRAAGGTMVLHSLRPMVQQILRVLRLDRVFHLAHDAICARQFTVAKTA